MTNKKRTKVIKGWAILTRRGNLYIAAPKTQTKRELRLEARIPDMPYKSIPCTITYELPPTKKSIKPKKNK